MTQDMLGNRMEDLVPTISNVAICVHAVQLGCLSKRMRVGYDADVPVVKQSGEIRHERHVAVTIPPGSAPTHYIAPPNAPHVGVSIVRNSHPLSTMCTYIDNRQSRGKRYTQPSADHDRKNRPLQYKSFRYPGP